ncbi:MAG: site-specific integrase, partial [Euryarchaeota archaeon]|nr:site-specific integrase [Euryarchaeota archaeon]
MAPHGTHAQSSLLDFGAPAVGSGGQPSSALPSGGSKPDIDEVWSSAANILWEAVRREGSVGEEWARRIRWHIARTPGVLRRAGYLVPPSPEALDTEHLRAVRDRLGWSRNGLAVYFSALRRLLRSLRHPLADHAAAWRLPSGEATRRRWLQHRDLLVLAQAAQGPEKVLVVLEGCNALRRIEVKRLRVRDLDFERGRMRVCGKGRVGGKWRTIPMTHATAAVLGPWVEGKASDALVLPRSASGLDNLLTRAVRRSGLGIRVSNHDLRRTFGRLAYQSGMSLVDLKNFMGHASVDMTTHYIGVDEDQMR